MLLRLPVEVALETFCGQDIAELLQLSRTSSHLRAFCTNYRALWLTASDAYKLQLPPGETVHTADTSLLLRSAARSVAIAHKWRCSADAPIHALRIHEAQKLYQLTAYAFWAPLRFAQPSFIGPQPPPILSILPGGRTLIIGDLQHLAIHDLEGSHTWKLVTLKTWPRTTSFPPQSVAAANRAVAWDSVDNGQRVVLAVVKSGYTKEHVFDTYLFVFVFDCAAGLDAARVTRMGHTLPDVDADMVSVQASRIFVSSSDTVHAFDLPASVPGSLVSVGTTNEPVDVVRYPKSSPDTTGVAVPDEVPEGGRVVRVDTIYGIVLVFRRGRLWLVQY
ncbi:F-box domain-containing protein [Mycena indigotica]|uniref:F-box domain-containing protein n=1 Tax=Mycena indigotica TaxID=2126181 RepID=A0A8H6T2U2_9AGAR|nr:F-box domain-containing protein [Mycena indigotica]KAF7309337.1 F-box domain-containing protein [Mycena indigotica]